MPSKFPRTSSANRPTKCRECNKPATASRRISTRGLCEPCAIDRVSLPARQLIAREGSAYEAWKAGMRAAAARLERAN